MHCRTCWFILSRPSWFMCFFLVIRIHLAPPQRLLLGIHPPPPKKKNSNNEKISNSKHTVDDRKREKVGKRSVGAAGKVSPKWSQETVINHSSNRVLKCDIIKMKFLKSWDLSGYSERTMSKRPTCQK